jgi:hypothetical protein
MSGFSRFSTARAFPPLFDLIMADPEVIVSVAALVIALTALVIACGQLLQQLLVARWAVTYGTEGYTALILAWRYPALSILSYYSLRLYSLLSISKPPRAETCW